jgi:hypothetical protein
MKEEELATVLKIDREAVYQAIRELLQAGLLITQGNSQAYELSYDCLQPYNATVGLPELVTDQKGISVDRDITADACLIRLLKNRLTLDRSLVFRELTSMIRHFRPTI